jgi:hypothetical protein
MLYTAFKFCFTIQLVPLHHGGGGGGGGGDGGVSFLLEQVLLGRGGGGGGSGGGGGGGGGDIDSSGPIHLLDDESPSVSSILGPRWSRVSTGAASSSSVLNGSSPSLPHARRLGAARGGRNGGRTPRESHHNHGHMLPPPDHSLDESGLLAHTHRGTEVNLEVKLPLLRQPMHFMAGASTRPLLSTT